ncbi:hypothetical protein [Sulfuricurvum sp.]|uniref:hypothetical protein n=1 Tax=Sulfuricurvum sp. TaxID=2025608 RepID=UPI003BB1F2EA
MSEEIIKTDSTTIAPKNWLDTLKEYKIYLSIGAAIVIVGTSALSHYKNERVKEELIKALGQYQQSTLMIGGELNYESVDCSGVLNTDCEIEGIKLSILGQEQFSAKAIRLGNMESLSKFKAFSKGEDVKASVDIEADGVSLPAPILEQVIAQNVSNAFQQNILDKLRSVNLAFKGEVEGNPMYIKMLNIDYFRIDNTIMPLEFSMKAREVSSNAPDTMILEGFSLTAQNRAISDVTYESVKSFTDTLSVEDKTFFLKEFHLTPAEMEDKAKASLAINGAIAKRFEDILPSTVGIVEKDLIQAMIQMLKGKTEKILLEGRNKNNLTMVEIQTALQQSSAMTDDAARKYMDDKFKIEVKVD